MEDQSFRLGDHGRYAMKSSVTEYVRFRVDDPLRFQSLQNVFTAIKAELDAPEDDVDDDEPDEYIDHDLDRIRALIPLDVQSNFFWPSADELAKERIGLSESVAIYPHGALLGVRWSLIRLLDLIFGCCEFELNRCEMVNDSTAEMHVITWSHPYGGLNALMGLIEGFGFDILGVYDCGRYESREELERNMRS